MNQSIITKKGKKITVKTKPDKVYGITSREVFQFDDTPDTFWRIKMNGTATKSKINTNDIIKTKDVVLTQIKDVYGYQMNFTEAK